VRNYRLALSTLFYGDETSIKIEVKFSQNEREEFLMRSTTKYHEKTTKEPQIISEKKTKNQITLDCRKKKDT
jgi:hypothetical protein